MILEGNAQVIASNWKEAMVFTSQKFLHVSKMKRINLTNINAQFWNLYRVLETLLKKWSFFKEKVIFKNLYNQRHS